MAQTLRSPLARVDGWGITAPNLDAAVAAITEKARDGKAFSVFTLNLDHLAKLRTNEAFRNAYRNADVVTADGWPVAWLARWQNRSIERATGADMLMPLLDAATNDGLPVFFFGASPETLDKAAKKLDEHSDGLLKIAGMLAPSIKFDPGGAEADAAIAKIAASEARLCIVALGAPKQEIFAQRAREKGLSCGMLCVGAAIDFVAGSQVRAPGCLRRSGLEWLWRLATNPRRFAWRYAQCALLLGDILLTPIRTPAARERI